MNHKLPIILAVGMAIAVVALYTWDSNFPRIVWADESVQVAEGELSDVPESLRPTTYTLPRNIYLPEMLFLVVKDTDSLSSSRCKNMAFRTVDTFSRQVNSNLVRSDKKLYTLARIAYSECIDITLATHRDGL